MLTRKPSEGLVGSPLKVEWRSQRYPTVLPGKISGPVLDAFGSVPSTSCKDQPENPRSPPDELDQGGKAASRRWAIGSALGP